MFVRHVWKVMVAPLVDRAVALREASGQVYSQMVSNIWFAARIR